MSLEPEARTANEYRAACGDHCAQPGELARQMSELHGREQMAAEALSSKDELIETLRADNERLREELRRVRSGERRETQTRLNEMIIGGPPIGDQ
jgi:hypothetical protein